MKKVLFILPDLRGGGAERVVLNLLRNLDKKNISITLFLFWRSGIYWNDIPKDIRVVCVTDKGKLSYLLPLIFLKLMKESISHDIIIGALEIIPTYLTFLVGKLLNKPTVAWVHTQLDLYFKQINPIHRYLSCFIYNRMNTLVFPSSESAKVLANMLDQSINKNYHIIPNPFDISAYSNIKKTSGDDWAERVFSRPVVIAVGRLSKEKGYDILIRSHSKLLKENVVHNLLILGEGTQREELEKYIALMGVSDSVFMPGFVHNPVSYMKKATVFVSSSRFEGFGMVLLEAIYSGTPIVATNCPGGPREILDNGKYGILVPIDDEYELSKSIRIMLEQIEVRKKFKHSAKNHLTKYSPARIALIWEQLLSALV